MNVKIDLPQLKAFLDQLPKAEDITRFAGTAYLSFFKERFLKEAWRDEAEQRWPARSMPEGGGKRGLLVKSGALRRSLTLAVSGASFTISSPLPYAKIHNEGGTLQVTKKMRKFFWAQYYLATKRKRHQEAARWKGLALMRKGTITIPKRQFMGLSKFVDAQVVKYIEQAIQRDKTLES